MACRGRLIETGNVICQDCLFREQRLVYDARAVTYTNAASPLPPRRSLSLPTHSALG